MSPKSETAAATADSLVVVASLGVPRETALRGMYASEPDCGALKLFRVTEGERRMTFVNALAANLDAAAVALR